MTSVLYFLLPFIVIAVPFGIYLYLQVKNLKIRVDLLAQYSSNPFDPQPDHEEDRDHLLLLVAASFAKANKLSVEKKDKYGDRVILAFHLKNGTVRFSIDENKVPSHLTSGVIRITSERINSKLNYQLIKDLVNDR